MEMLLTRNRVGCMQQEGLHKTLQWKVRTESACRETSGARPVLAAVIPKCDHRVAQRRRNSQAKRRSHGLRALPLNSRHLVSLHGAGEDTAASWASLDLWAVQSSPNHLFDGLAQDEGTAHS